MLRINKKTKKINIKQMTELYFTSKCKTRQGQTCACVA